MAGTVRSAATGAPIGGACVQVSPNFGWRSCETFTAPDGTYSVRLLQAPGADVTIAINTDGQVITVPASLVFMP